MTAEEAREIVEAFEIENPDAFLLAKIVSLAVRIEPEYVRAARLNLLRSVHAGAESDLWFSPLVQSQTPMALEFFPEVVEILRAGLAADQELLQQAWEELKRLHSNAPFALRLEEELTWLGLSSKNNQELIEKRLESVLVALRKEARIGLAQWAKRALPTLPEKARATDAARRLSLVAGIQTGVGPVLSEMPSKGLSQEWFNQFTAKKLDPVPVGVRLLKKVSQPINGDSAAQEGAVPDSAKEDALPMILEFSYPPAPQSESIEVPDTYRLLLEASWQDESRNYIRQVSLLPQEIQHVEVGYGEVRIRTALGAAYMISPHFDYDFIILYNEADEGLAKSLIARLEQQDWRGERLTVNSFVIDPNFVYLSEAEASGATISLGRKVGFIISTASMNDLPILQAMIPLRPEPRSKRDWLITILTTDNIASPFVGDNQVIDFVRRDQFEESYRALWTSLTGEHLPSPIRSPETADDLKIAPVEVFTLYSHRDESLYLQLANHLKLLERQDLITLKDYREIKAGDVWSDTINNSLERAEIILILVSADFLASDLLSNVAMKRALDRHEDGETRIIPIILRPCMWKRSPLGNLQALPKDARPVIDWENRDAAFINIFRGIEKVVEEVLKEKSGSHNIGSIPRPPAIGFVPRRDRDGRNIVTRLIEELAPGKNRIVALWGGSGGGKTTLAAEAARRLASRYGRRIVWIGADGRPDFTLQTLLDEAATQLGEPETRKLALEPKEEAVREMIARYDVVIVLDNFETISSEEQRRCAQWIANNAPCPALITTRSRVGGARNVPVNSMTLPEANEFLDRLIEQVQNTNAFESLDRNVIIEAAEANPLVMQWVIAQIDLAQQPGDVLDDLMHGEGDAAERVFDRSFNLPQVGNDGRDTLLALSLFVPSASREALADVTGFGNEIRRLGEAVKSLATICLIRTTGADERWIIEGLTRDLAEARLSKDARANDFRRRFIFYFARYAEAHAEELPKDFDALEVEKDNLLNAIDIAFNLTDWENVLSIASVIAQPRGMLVLRGYLDPAIECNIRALEAARQTNRYGQVATQAYNLSALRANRGEISEAEQLSQEALKISYELDDQTKSSMILRQLASLKQYQGDRAGARGLYNQSLDISNKVDDRGSVAATLHNLGILAYEEGDAEQAMRLYNESLEIFKSLNNQISTAKVLNNLGILFQQQRRVQEARRSFAESLEINKRLNYGAGVANSLQRLGSLAREQGELEEAQRCFYEALAIYRQLGLQEGTAKTLSDMGILMQQKGDVLEARRLVSEALNILEKLKSPSAQRVRAILNDLEAPNA